MGAVVLEPGRKGRVVIPAESGPVSRASTARRSRIAVSSGRGEHTGCASEGGNRVIPLHSKKSTRDPPRRIDMR